MPDESEKSNDNQTGTFDNITSGGEHQKSNTAEIQKDPTLVIWAKERKNYVTPLNLILFQIKSPAKFGWKSAPYVGPEEGPSGILTSIHLSTLRKYRPTSLEVVDAGSPLAEFLGKLENEDFFNRVRWLRVHDSGAQIGDLCQILDQCKSVAVVEFHESAYESDERRQILELFASRPHLKGFDFIFDFGSKEINDWFTALRLKLHLVRFSGPPAVKLSAIRAISVDMPMVEFAALQDLDVDIQTEDPKNKNWHRDLLNRFCHIFPCLKYFFLDYKVFDTIFVYDDDTTRIFGSIRDFFFRLKLVCFAILIYCPDDDMKASVSKAAKFLVDSEIRTEVKEFFCGSIDAVDAKPNFRLLVLGDQVHARTERLVETVVGQRITVPDLRHFSYIIDLEAFLNPDSTLAFGGFDKDAVEKTYKEKHDSLSSPEFVPDTVLSRYVQG